MNLKIFQSKRKNFSPAPLRNDGFGYYPATINGTLCKKLNCQAGGKILDLVKLNGMKRLIAYGAVVFSTLVLLPSCSKNSAADFKQNSSLSPDKVINTKISPGQTHVINIDNSGELSIVRQASHFKISQTGINRENSALIYTYSPSEGFKGSDEVVLAHKTATGYSGTCNYGDAEGMSSSRTLLIAIKFTVAD